MALRDSKRLKEAEGGQSGPLIAFWAAAAAYSFSFAFLRLLGLLELDAVLHLAYYAQTVAGALTIAALMQILFSIVVGREAGRWAARGFLLLAVGVVVLIFIGGIQGPRQDAWSVEFLPEWAFVRAAIGIIYVVAPVAMSFALLGAVQQASDAVFKRRARLFAGCIVCLYIPGAIKYVWFVSSAASLALALMFLVGSLLGWLSYRPAPAGNG